MWQQYNTYNHADMGQKFDVYMKHQNAGWFEYFCWSPEIFTQRVSRVYSMVQ